VTDCKTGALVSWGKTRKGAIEAATNRLERAGEAGYLAAVRYWGEPKE